MNKILFWGGLLLFPFTGWTEAPVEQGTNLRRIEKDLQALQAFVYKNVGHPEEGEIEKESSPKPIDSNGPLLLEKVTELQTRLATLIGKVEELEFGLKQLQQAQEKEGQHVAKKLETLETDKNILEDKQLMLELKTLAPEEVYAKAKTYKSQKNYPNEEKVLKFFVNTFPKNPLITTVYWDLAFLSYELKKYDGAIFYGAQVYKKDPKGPKAAEALFKMAQAFKALNKSIEACTTLGKLQEEFAPLPETLALRFPKAWAPCQPKDELLSPDHSPEKI